MHFGVYAVLIALLGAPASQVRAAFVVQGTRLAVEFPDEGLSFNVSLADFGLPEYGLDLRGRAFHPSDGFTETAHSCSASDYWGASDVPGPADCSYGCAPFEDAEPPVSVAADLPEVSGAVFFILNRGPVADNFAACSFLHKALAAQRAGADCVVIISDQDVLTTMDTPSSEDLLEVDLNIPAVMMGRTDGAKLLSLMKHTDGAPPPEVILTLHLKNVIKERSKVRFEVWSDSGDACGPHCAAEKRVFEESAPILKALIEDDRLEVVPGYIIWQCPTAYVDSDRCREQCIAKGRYCVPNPDSGEEAAGYTGSDVVLENLRQTCVWQIGQEEGMPLLWLDYKVAFGKRCSMLHSKDAPADKRFGRACSLQVFAGVLEDAEEHRMFDVADLSRRWENCWAPGQVSREDPSPNHGDFQVDLFEDMFLRQAGGVIDGVEVGHISINPTFRINLEQYRGAIATLPLLRGVCAAYFDAQEPAICSDLACQELGVGTRVCTSAESVAKGTTSCVTDDQGYHCACGPGYNANPKDLDECTRIDQGGIPLWLLPAILVPLLVGVAAFLLIYHRRQQRSVDEQVRSVMSQYMPLEDGDDGVADSPGRRFPGAGLFSKRREQGIKSVGLVGVMRSSSYAGPDSEPSSTSQTRIEAHMMSDNPLARHSDEDGP